MIAAWCRATVFDSGTPELSGQLLSYGQTEEG
jgi:hypothetical protein